MYCCSSAAAYEVKEYYSWNDLKNKKFQYDEKLGDPGQFPFTRSPFPEMYRKRPWIISHHSGHGLPDDCNPAYKRLIQYGAEAISMAVHLPMQVGLDSDHPLSEGEVGRVGVAIDSLRDLEILFEGIEIDKLRQVGMLGNSIGPIALAFFLALAEKKGLEERQWCISLQNDVLREYASRGTHIFPMASAVRIAADAVKYCAQKKLLHFKPLAVCGAHMAEAGAGWEIAFAMSDALAYLDHMVSSGMRIDEVAPLVRLFLSVGSATLDLFEEVAKARAARRLWARLMKERYGARDQDSMRVQLVSFITPGAKARQPIDNIARIALGARAAVLAGVETMHTACWDEGFTPPPEEAIQVAVRTQQILRHESGSLVATADPMGGAYFLEDLTDRIEEDARAKMRAIEKQGGAIDAIRKGFYREQISAGAHRVQSETWNEKREQGGENLFRRADEKSLLGRFKIDPAAEKKQIEELKKLRRERHNRRVRETLQKVRLAAENSENLVPPILEAVKEYATVQEICDEMRAVFGKYPEKPIHP
jgi:methylmalonyl-CoA mutase N-terminal domain/subunit